MPFGGALTAALIGGGASLLSSHAASKSAAHQGEEQREFQSRLAAPGLELEKLQLDQFKDITAPIQKQLFQFILPTAKTQFDLFQNIQAPALRQLFEQATQAQGQPLGIPNDLADQIFQRGKNRISSSFEPTRQKASERLAAGGNLDSGAALKLFESLDEQEQQQIEDFAFERAITEFELARNQEQQVFQNFLQLFGAGGGAPQINLPSTSAVGSGAGLINSFTPVPNVGVDIGGATKTGLELFDLFGGFDKKGGTVLSGGSGGASPFQIENFVAGIN